MNNDQNNNQTQNPQDQSTTQVTWGRLLVALGACLVVIVGAVALDGCL